MKKNYTFFAALCTVALAASCTKELTTPETLPVEKTYTVEVSSADESESKTILSDEEILWFEDDSVAFIQRYFKEDGSRTYQTKLVTLSQTRKTFAVNLSFNEPAEGTEVQYYSVFPYQPDVLKWYSDGDYIKPLVSVPDHQAPHNTSFDDNSDILVSKIMTYNEKQTRLCFPYIRTTAIGMMTLTNLEVNSLDSVKFTAKSDGSYVKLAGKLYVDMKEGKFGSFASSRTSLVLDCFRLSVVRSEMDVYFSCVPFLLSMGDEFTVTAYTKDYVYTRHVTIPDGRPLLLAQGCMTQFGVDMSQAVKSGTWFTVTKKDPTASSLSFAVSCPEKNIASVKYCVVSASDYEGIVDPEEYVEQNGTEVSATAITGLNEGKIYTFSKSKLTADTAYKVLVLATDTDGHNLLVTYDDNTDWMGDLVGYDSSDAKYGAKSDKIYFKVSCPAKNIQSLKYCAVKSEEFAGIENVETHVADNGADYTANGIEKLNGGSTMILNVAGLAPDTSYKILALATSTDGRTSVKVLDAATSWFDGPVVYDLSDAQYGAKRNMIYFKVSGPAKNIQSLKYCCMTADAYAEMENVENYVENNGTEYEAINIDKLNDGKTLISSVSSLAFNTSYKIVALATSTDGRTSLKVQDAATAWFDVRAAVTNTAGRANYYSYGADDLTKIVYAWVLASDLDGKAASDYESYFNSITKYGYSDTALSSVKSNGATGYGVVKTGLTSGEKYVFMAKATNSSSKTLFRYSATITVK